MVRSIPTERQSKHTMKLMWSSQYQFTKCDGWAKKMEFWNKPVAPPPSFPSHIIQQWPGICCLWCGTPVQQLDEKKQLNKTDQLMNWQQKRFQLASIFILVGGPEAIGWILVSTLHIWPELKMRFVLISFRSTLINYSLQISLIFT